ncbi:MAG: hypothetical protein ACXV8I_00010 [Methylobacter sp.]
MEASRLGSGNRKTINRKQCADLLGIGIHKLTEIIRHHKYLEFPEQMNTGYMNQLYYEDEVLEFKATKDYHGIKWTQPPKPSDVKLDSFDNKAAVKFLSRPAISDEEITLHSIISKHCRKFGKTTVVHLKERNDYVPPRSDLTLFRACESYQVHVAGGY